MDTNYSTSDTSLRPPEGVTLTKLQGEERIDFPAKLFGLAFLNYEMAIYNKTEEVTNGAYSSGYWEFYKVQTPDHGTGFLMVLEGNDQIAEVTNPDNFFEGEMTLEAISLAMNSYLSSHFSFNDPKFGTNYHAIYETVLNHPEVPKIIGFLD